MSKCEQADGHSRRAGGYHQHLKRRKRRTERHAAKLNPETPPKYGRYSGWET